MNGQSLKQYLKRRSIWFGLYAIYLVFILISVYAFMAEDSISDIRTGMDEKYTYNLLFTKDGKSTHYDVTLHDTGTPGRITLTYWTQDNKLDVTKVQNIKTLKIDVQSMYEDESMKVFKRPHTSSQSLPLMYWLEADGGVFTVEFNIDKSEPMESLTFTKFPEPKSVTVNSQEWWKTSTNYVVSEDEITISSIPTGKTTVVLNFKEIVNKMPVAAFTMNPSTIADVNENITFDASTSTDPDGTIVSWVWDFGDQSSDSGKTLTHKYTKTGTYTVKLTVRDDAAPFGEDWTTKQITIQYGAEDDFDGDGLRDAWEMKYFNSTAETGDDDYDGDGATNLEEYEAGTDPTDIESKPPDKESDDSETTSGDSSGMIMMLAVVIIVVIILIVLMVIFKSKKSKAPVEVETEEEEEEREEKDEETDEEAIAELESKIKRAKSLGLPTRELEKLLREAKEGKALEVTPIEQIKRSGPGKGKGKSGMSRGRGGGRRRR